MKVLDRQTDTPAVFRKKRSRGRFVWPVVGLVIVAIVIYAVVQARSGASAATQIQYEVATVDYGSVKKSVSATGVLEPWSTVDIKSKAGGRVNALLVDVGSVVHTGQVIAKIDPADTLLTVQTAQANMNGAVAHTDQAQVTYELQKAQSEDAVVNAQAALVSSQAAYASAQQQAIAQPALTEASIRQAAANLNQAVQARKALDSTDPQDKASAQAAYDQAVANETAAKATLDRQVTLAQEGFVPQQTVDTDQASYQVAVATTANAKEKLSTIDAEQAANVDSADAKVVQARAALASARASEVDVATKRAAMEQAKGQLAEAQSALALAKANVANNAIKQYDISFDQSQVAGNKAALSNAQTTLAQTTVTSPSDGVVITKDVSEGTYITSGESLTSAGATIVTIGDITRMYVQAEVDETDMSNISEGQHVDVSFNSYPDMPFDGTVARIDPQAVVNQNVTQFNVRVEIDNSSPTFRLLKPGMNATCDFIVGSKDDVLQVPSSAVQGDDTNGYSVQIARGGHMAPADPATGMPASPDTLIGVKLIQRTIQVGLQGDDTTEITSGLKQGDRVVTQTIQPVSTAAAAPSSPFGGGGGFGRGGGGGGRGR